MSTGAVQRWILSSHTIAGMLSSFGSSIKLNQFKNKFKDIGKTSGWMKPQLEDHNIIKLWGNLFQ